MTIMYTRFSIILAMGIGLHAFPFPGHAAEGGSMPDGEKEAGAGGEVVTVHDENASITAKLSAIVIPSLDFENASLDECINVLRIRAAEHDDTTDVPEEAGVEMVVRYPRQLGARVATLRVASLSLREVTLGNALQSICDAIGYRYRVDSSVLILEPIASTPIVAAAASVPATMNLPNSMSGEFVSSELSKTLSPLIKPDVDSARMVLANLQQLVERSSGAEKVAMLQVASVIRNVFTAEFQVGAKLKARENAETAAKHQRRVAAEWLKPNAFGTVNRDAARAAFAKAEEIMKNAKAELNDAREQLIRQLRDADASILIYHKRNDYHVVITLATAMLVVSERSLPVDSHRPMFAREDIATMQRFLNERGQWLVDAQQAEASEDFETAIQLYGKARDDDSLRRCANLLAIDLEQNKQLDKAIEYYEMAGKHEKAEALRNSAANMLQK